MIPLPPKSIKISPKYTAQNFLDLDLSQTTSNDWETAIQIFEDRMNGRFFAQIKQLQSHPDSNIKAFSGFVIVAIDCLLIETMVQFQNGLKETPPRKSVDAFHSFFQLSGSFSLFFHTRDKSRIFYEQIRCGLLHQAQTQSRSTIHVKKGAPVLDWINPADLAQGLRVHRDKFHEEIVRVFDNYIIRLKSRTDASLMSKFTDKMNFIARQE
jgi:hypothetical protein